MRKMADNPRASMMNGSRSEEAERTRYAVAMDPYPHFEATALREAGHAAAAMALDRPAIRVGIFNFNFIGPSGVASLRQLRTRNAHP